MRQETQAEKQTTPIKLRHKNKYLFMTKKSVPDLNVKSKQKIIIKKNPKCRNKDELKTKVIVSPLNWFPIKEILYGNF